MYLLSCRLGIQSRSVFLPEHRCLGTQARVQWGGFEHSSGSVIIEGVLYDRSKHLGGRCSPCSSNSAQASLGLEDLRDEKWEIWGPLSPDKLTRDGEYLVETSAGESVAKTLVKQLGLHLVRAKPLPLGEMNFNFV